MFILWNNILVFYCGVAIFNFLREKTILFIKLKRLKTFHVQLKDIYSSSFISNQLIHKLILVVDLIKINDSQLTQKVIWGNKKILKYVDLNPKHTKKFNIILACTPFYPFWQNLTSFHMDYFLQWNYFFQYLKLFHPNNWANLDCNE